MRLQSRTTVLTVLVSIFLSGLTLGAGFVHNDNFTIFTPPQPSQQAAEEFAAALLVKAEQFRKQIAVEWFEQELPPSVGQTIVNVSFSGERGRGLTWAKDHADRKYHTLYLTGSDRQELESLLAHEMVHVVFATHFPHPNRLPAWLEEGIACRYDDKQRQRTRDEIMKWMARTGNWTRLAKLLSEENIDSHDQTSYAASATVTAMLLSRANKETLFEFAQAAQEIGWDASLKRYYEIDGVSQLQAEWQAWATASKESSGQSTTVNQR